MSRIAGAASLVRVEIFQRVVEIFGRLSCYPKWPLSLTLLELKLTASENQPKLSLMSETFL